MSHNHCHEGANDHCKEGACASSAHHHHDNCCQQHSHDDFAHHLLEVADEAWMEVLKEKIKDQIRQHNGAHLDELAKLVAETNNTRWKNKLGQQNTWGDFKGKIDSFFKK